MSRLAVVMRDPVFRIAPAASDVFEPGFDQGEHPPVVRGVRPRPGLLGARDVDRRRVGEDPSLPRTAVLSSIEVRRAAAPRRQP